jgi:hypothetical protein
MPGNNSLHGRKSNPRSRKLALRVTALPAQKVGAYQTLDLHLAKPLGLGFAFTAAGQGLFQPHHLEWGTGDPTQTPVGINRAAYIQLASQSPHRSSH